jgi:hypothetical protein
MKTTVHVLVGLAIAALQFSCFRGEPLPPPDRMAVAAVTSGSIAQVSPIRVVFNEMQDTTRPLSPDTFRVRTGSGGQGKGPLDAQHRGSGDPGAA